MKASLVIVNTSISTISTPVVSHRVVPGGICAISFAVAFCTCSNTNATARNLLTTASSSPSTASARSPHISLILSPRCIAPIVHFPSILIIPLSSSIPFPKSITKSLPDIHFSSANKHHIRQELAHGVERSRKQILFAEQPADGACERPDVEISDGTCGRSSEAATRLGVPGKAWLGRNGIGNGSVKSRMRMLGSLARV